MNTQYDGPFGCYSLARYPTFKSKLHQTLQAWEGADTLLLEHFSALLTKREKPKELLRVLIVNDQFGALTCSLATFSPVVQNDSFLSRYAIQCNVESNKDRIGDKHSTIEYRESTAELSGHFNVVLMKVPKSLAMLEDQLFRLRSHVSNNTDVLASCMVKSLSKNTRELFERILGPSTQSLAAKKARVIHCTPGATQWKDTTPYPRTFKAYGKDWLCHANVFAEGRVDAGTQVFLAHLGDMPKCESVIDLACGNGIMGIETALVCGAKKAYFCDESSMACASAAENCKQHIPDVASAIVLANGIGESVPTVDLIVCNPPFHQQHAMGTELAHKMFEQAYRHLREGGELWVIANRHLAYHSVLKKNFSRCTNIAKHHKYVLLRCVK